MEVPIEQDPSSANAAVGIRAANSAYLKRWDRALLVTTWAYTAGAALFLVRILDTDSRWYYWADGKMKESALLMPAMLLLVSIALWVGRAFYNKNGGRGAAMGFYRLGGLLGFPLGLLILSAAKRLEGEGAWFVVPDDGNMSFGPAFGATGLTLAVGFAGFPRERLIHPAAVFAVPIAFMVAYATRGFLDGNPRRGIQALVAFGAPALWFILGMTLGVDARAVAVLYVFLPPIMLLLLRWLPVPRAALRAIERPAGN